MPLPRIDHVNREGRTTKQTKLWIGLARPIVRCQNKRNLRRAARRTVMYEPVTSAKRRGRG